MSVLVIVLGNLVAIVLEGIIASVQALRLEYYEFFGKFFSGTGQAFHTHFVWSQMNKARHSSTDVVLRTVNWRLCRPVIGGAI